MNRLDMRSRHNRMPCTVDEAVNYLLIDLSLNDELEITLMKKEDLPNLHFSFGGYIRNTLCLWSGNESLLKSCRLLSGNENMHEDDASMVIIQALWERLKDKDNMGLSAGEKRESENEA